MQGTAMFAILSFPCSITHTRRRAFRLCPESSRLLTKLCYLFVGLEEVLLLNGVQGMPPRIFNALELS